MSFSEQKNKSKIVFGMIKFMVELTTEANPSMAEIHNRMPVVLTKPEMALWLTNTETAVNILHSDRPMLQKVLA